MGLPIACTLTSAEMAKLKETYVAARHLYEADAQIHGNEALIDLKGDKAALGPFLDSLVARETQCCAFLTFELHEAEKGYRLRMSGDSVDAHTLSVMVELLFPSATVQVHTSP